MKKEKKQTYTIKQVAELSSVSIRTLRFYDEIELLKPSYYGDNGYRYYEMAQLLRLQQILFYRELKFDLTTIQKILSEPGFDNREALVSHRQRLAKEIENTKILIGTIDKTLAHLEKETPMNNDEIYMGFDSAKQAAYEQEIIDQWGESARLLIDESKKRTQTWKKTDFDKMKQDYHEIHTALGILIDAGEDPKNDRVQTWIQRHHAVVSQFWTPGRASYIGLGKSYCSHPDFKKMYDEYHPELALYLAEAITIYAEKNLN